MKTKVERKSERELVVTRLFNGPQKIVFEAWTTPDIFINWWVPKSMGFKVRSYEAEIRTGGSYRLVFEIDGSEMAFFGTYKEVTPTSKMVWTNEESPDGPLTTVTFEARGEQTLVVLTELHPSKEALDAAGEYGVPLEALDQLEALLATRAAR